MRILIIACLLLSGCANHSMCLHDIKKSEQLAADMAEQLAVALQQRDYCVEIGQQMLDCCIETQNEIARLKPEI